MFDTVLGIPVHPLVVHAVVVLAPITALLMLLFAGSSRFRAWSGVLTPAVATITLALSPLATESGESLERRLPGSEAIEEHAELGDTMTWVLLAAAVVAWLMWWFWRRDRGRVGDQGAPVPMSGVSKALAVVGVLAALGLVVDVALVGHSGAQSVWEDIGSQPVPDGGDDD
jgi:uncharacterized membrane protein